MEKQMLAGDKGKGVRAKRLAFNWEDTKCLKQNRLKKKNWVWEENNDAKQKEEWSKKPTFM